MPLLCCWITSINTRCFMRLRFISHENIKVFFQALLVFESSVENENCLIIQCNWLKYENLSVFLFELQRLYHISIYLICKMVLYFSHFYIYETGFKFRCFFLYLCKITFWFSTDISIRTRKYWLSKSVTSINFGDVANTCYITSIAFWCACCKRLALFRIPFVLCKGNKSCLPGILMCTIFRTKINTPSC